MKQEERILRALGNVKDSFLLEVSGYMGDPRKEVLIQPKKKKWPGFAGLAAAAALMITGVLSLYAATGGERLDTPLPPILQAVAPEEVEQKAWPAFHLEYDAGELAMTESEEGVFLTPIDYADYLPPSDIQIEFLPGLLPYAAMEKTRAEMTDGLLNAQLNPQTGVYTLHISPEEVVWDAEVKDVWIVGAGSCGSFRLTARYFIEAVEGWGMTFSQICSSFTCPLSDSPSPEAEKAIMEFAEVYFSGNQLLMLSNYYGDSGNLKDMYTQDASRVRITDLRGLEGLEEQIKKNGSGTVSLVFLETEQSDSYTYLTMEVTKTQAGYRVSAYGLEK